MRPFEESPDLRALAEDYLKDPGPNASQALAAGLLANAVRRSYSNPAASGLERSEPREYPQARSQSHKAHRTATDQGCLDAEPVPSEGLLSGPCYSIGDDAEGTSETNAAGQSKEGGRADRQAAEGSGRGRNAQAETKGRTEAINFLRFYFSQGDYEVTTREAERGLDAVLTLLHVQDKFDVALRERFKLWKKFGCSE